MYISFFSVIVSVINFGRFFSCLLLTISTIGENETNVCSGRVHEVMHHFNAWVFYS